MIFNTFELMLASNAGHVKIILILSGDEKN